MQCPTCQQEHNRIGQRLCPRCHREYQRKWRAEQAQKFAPVIAAERRDQRLKGKYNLTPEQFDAMLDRQDDACAICITQFGESPNDRPRVDHDHKTGKVRGLLCNKCNVALGLMDDEPAFFDLAARYLREHRQPAKPKMTMQDILSRFEITETGEAE